jgi:ABC-type transport system involved in Fe-S cluster assembly, permease component
MISKRIENILQAAKAALGKKAVYGKDVDPVSFSDPDAKRDYIDNPGLLPRQQQKTMETVGMDLSGQERAGTFLQMDHSVVHCNRSSDGVEIMSTTEALKCHKWLEDYLWQAVSPDADKYTARVALHGEHGYFIRALPGVKVDHPVQACMYIGQDDLVQDVHNIVIVEEGAELHVITGCTTDPGVRRGMHIGISEFFVKKGAKLTFTMIHRWGEEVAVRPRTGVIVEEGGLYLSNYICLQKAHDIQMYPTTKLVGKGAVARLNTILAAPAGSHMDVGGRVILSAPETRGEIIARTLSTGGTVINRGQLVGQAPGCKAHLECHGLILGKQGVIHAIPELNAETGEAELSHEAAVGKIAPEEIEYLMARGMTEEEAAATIVRGFLHIKIDGLPSGLAAEIEKTLGEFDAHNCS